MFFAADELQENRDRLLRGEVSQKFFEQVKGQAEVAGLLDDQHFTVDGNLHWFISLLTLLSSGPEARMQQQLGGTAKNRALPNFLDVQKTRTVPARWPSAKCVFL